LTRLALITHAATTATRSAAFATDEPVERHGLTQAGSITVRRHDVALCSPAKQCVETATALSLRPRIDEALRDCDFGRWKGCTLEDVAGDEPEAIGAWLTDPDAAPHGGESVRDVIHRTGIWLHDLAPTTATTRTVLAVTHPAVVRALIVTTLGADAQAFWRIDVPPLTETVLIGSGTRWTLRSTGSAPGT
jgi:broad specificity phosphatase PhoE